MSREAPVESCCVPVTLVKRVGVNKGARALSRQPPEAPLRDATCRSFLVEPDSGCRWSFWSSENRSTTLGSRELNAYGFRRVRVTSWCWQRKIHGSKESGEFVWAGRRKGLPCRGENKRCAFYFSAGEFLGKLCCSDGCRRVCSTIFVLVLIAIWFYCNLVGAGIGCVVVLARCTLYTFWWFSV